MKRISAVSATTSNKIELELHEETFLGFLKRVFFYTEYNDSYHKS